MHPSAAGQYSNDLAPQTTRVLYLYYQSSWLEVQGQCPLLGSILRLQV